LIQSRIQAKLKALHSNPKEVYKTALRKYTPTIPKWLKDEDGSFFLDPSNKIRIFTQAWKKIYEPYSPPPNNNDWSFLPKGPYSGPLTHPITKDKFYKAIGKSYKAPGRSAIPYEVLKNLPNNVLDLYVQLFNQILIHKNIPESWKVAHILLLEKDPHNTQDPLCYRPISFLECQYKIFSAIIYGRIKNHIYNNNHISPLQLGFKKGVSTHSHITTLINTLEDAKQFHKTLHIASIDLVKAYDCIQHWTIKQALIRANIDPNIVDLILNMHTGAQACISTPHYRGEYFPLNRGVRQGDVIAPLLYNLAINPIIKEVNKLKGYHIKDCPQQVACLAYADDLLLISNTQEDLQLMCHKLSSFLEHHSININPNKTIYTANVPTIPISIQNHIILPLEENQAFKYLGIWFTANFDWTKSVQCSLQSAIRKLSILKTKKWIPLDTKIFIINNIILKAFEYTANFVPFDDYSSKILFQEIATCIKHSIPMNKLTPSDQIWASEEAGGLALTHTLTLINVAILRTAYRVSLSNTNDLASLSAQARTINDNYLNFIGSPFFSHFPNQDNIKQNPIFCSYYARVAKAAEFLNLNIQCNHNISPFPDDYMTHKYLADKLNSFNVQINQLIINKHLVSYNELHKLAPTITTNDYQVLKADVPNIIHKQASKLKGSAPFKLTPQNLSPTTCTIWNSNNVLIWTDGSTHIKDNNKNIHGWGVFFKQGSGLNTWKRTNLEFDITSAELTAIEHALSVAPLSQHTTIFSDSLNAVNFIKDSPSWPLPTWNKCPYSSTLYRISCLIKQRKNLNNLVQIHHVYSHIEDKRKKWPKHKLHLLDEQEKHLNTLFPNFYKHIIEGNCQADILAAKATLTSKTHYLLPPNPVKYTLIDKTTGKQVFNLGAQGKFIQARTWNDILLSRKGPTLGCHKTARKAVNSVCFGLWPPLIGPLNPFPSSVADIQPACRGAS